jgi:hypothetical protein
MLYTFSARLTRIDIWRIAERGKLFDSTERKTRKISKSEALNDEEEMR